MSELRFPRCAITSVAIPSVSVHDNCQTGPTIRNDISNILTFTNIWGIKHHISDSIYNIVLRIQKMITALGKAFEGSRGKIAAAVIGASVTLASLGGAASAQDVKRYDAAIRPQATQPAGKHVTLRVGPGFSLSAADGLAGILEKNGCTTNVTTERGIPKRLGVEVGEKSFRFTEIGSAGAAALDWCLEKS